jgi:hypothetical protein
MPAHPAIAPQFQRFVDDELSRSPALIDAIAVGTIEQLRQPTGGMLSPQEKQHYLELIDHLRQRHGLLRDGFVDTLGQLVRNDLQERNSDIHSASGFDFGDFGGTLTLMDEGQVEADIEISRAALLIDGTAEWELRELQTFTSTLNGQQHVTPESNPFRPVFYARALWHGACAITSAPVQRGIFLRLASGVASGLLKKAWAAASSRIEAMGITPGMYRTVVLNASSTGGSRVPPKGGVAPSASTEAALPGVPQAPATLGWAREQLNNRQPRQANASHAAASNDLGLPDLPRSGFTPGPEFEQALLRLEQLLAQLPAQVAGSGLHSELAAPRLRDHLQALTSATSERSDHQIIELMARFFDVVLSDTQVHAACRPLLVKLQSSALQVALDDPSMLADHQHAVWLFMDQLSEAYALYFHPGDPRLAALCKFADALVQEMTASSTQDVWLYRRALTRFSGHIQSAREAELAAAQTHVDELLLLEKRDHLQRQISQRLVDQMVPLRVSPGVRRFVTGEWARVLAHAMLRHGEQSETTIAYMKAVDDLLWSLNPPDHPQSRQRLLHLLPTLLHRLRTGMSLIALPSSEQEHIMNELMALHTDALRPGNKSSSGGVVGLAPTSAATPEQIVQMLRDEPTPTPQLGPSFADSLIELSSMDTVPAELLETHPPGEDSDFSSPVDAMAVGHRARLFLRGRWSRVQLLWRSPKGSYFLFAGEAPGRTHSITQAALERLSGEKLLLPLEEQVLSQRALKAVIEELG